MKNCKKMMMIFLVSGLLLGLFAGLPTAVLTAPLDITDMFSDANFKTSVYELIGKTAPEPILNTDVAEVTTLDIHAKNIQSLDGLEYFSSLKFLLCQYNQLTALPVLPLSLVVLECHNNMLTALPALPSGLSNLSCAYNQISVLPALPPGLDVLHCDTNQLISLPVLPAGLAVLYCRNNQLTELDITGLMELEALHCSGNSMTNPDDVKGFTGIWDGFRCSFAPQQTDRLPLPGLSDWAEEEADELHARALIPIPLQNNFQKPIQRDEFMALMIGIVFNKRGWAIGDVPFTDIEDNPYDIPIRLAYTYKLADGTSPARFSPDSLLTREQAAKFLFAIVNMTNNAVLGDGTPGFTDSAEISGWARPYVAYCENNNIMLGGSSGIFKPQDNLTREEAIIIAERLIKQYDILNRQ